MIQDLLYPYQVRARDALADAIELKGFALDASETGLGKTYHSLATCDLFGLDFAVVCKAVAVDKWKTTIERLGMAGNCLNVASWDMWRNGKYPHLCVLQKHGKRKDYHFPSTGSKQKAIIFDEVQMAGGENSSNSRLLIGARRSPHVRGVFGLSATPADSPLRMKALGFCADMHQIENFWWWCQKNGCGKSPFGGLYFRQCGKQKKGHPRGCDCSRRAVLEKLHNHLFPAYGVKITREEAEVDLPEERIEVELWDCERKLPPSLQPFMDNIDVKELEDFEKADAGQSMGGVGNIRERQRAELMRVVPLSDEVADYVRAGYSCPVFLAFSASIDGLVALLKERGVECGILDGRDKARAKSSHSRFQLNELRAMAIQLQAGSDSIDLDDQSGGHPRCSFISPYYSGDIMTQVLGRCSRVTTKSPVLQRIIFAEGTVEERVYKIASRRAQNIRAMTDGDWREGWL